MESKNEKKWIEISEVYNQDEAHLISGLLSMAGIQVKVEREAIGDLYGLTIGPLAKIKILVPEDQLTEAEKILVGNVEDPEIVDEE